MVGWGAMLLVLGIGSFILPLTGMQFRLMMPLQGAQPAAGIAVSALGLLLIVLGSVRANARRAQAAAQQPAPQWPPYALNTPPPLQQGAAWSGAMQTGNCMRCGHPLWAGDVVCRMCRLPVNFGRPQQQQPVYAAPPTSPPVALRCPNPACGQTARPGKKFCARCGTRLA